MILGKPRHYKKANPFDPGTSLNPPAPPPREIYGTRNGQPYGPVLPHEMAGQGGGIPQASVPGVTAQKPPNPMGGPNMMYAPRYAPPPPPPRRPAGQPEFGYSQALVDRAKADAVARRSATLQNRVAQANTALGAGQQRAGMPQRTGIGLAGNGMANDLANSNPLNMNTGSGAYQAYLRDVAANRDEMSNEISRREQVVSNIGDTRRYQQEQMRELRNQGYTGPDLVGTPSGAFYRAGLMTGAAKQYEDMRKQLDDNLLAAQRENIAVPQYIIDYATRYGQPGEIAKYMGRVRIENESAEREANNYAANYGNAQGINYGDINRALDETIRKIREEFAARGRVGSQEEMDAIQEAERMAGLARQGKPYRNPYKYFE